ncbi:MAG: hypothetical protein HHJ11_11015 [Phycicoccus sp.]|nr:hypothetical protein [Phycicoccus sp.]NMM35194.1 hypothetical protein [Phycicoccus sp.]
MTDHPTPTPSSATSRANEQDAVVQACVHIDAAARQLEAAANGDVFSSLLGLAGLLTLIRGGINPTLRAVVNPGDRLGPIAHVDRALFLLDSAHPSIAPADLLVWNLRLADLRDALPDALLAAWAGRP